MLIRAAYLIFLFSIFFGLVDYGNIYSGIIGYEIVSFLDVYINSIGIIFLLVFMSLLYLTFRLKLGLDDIKRFVNFVKSLRLFKTKSIKAYDVDTDQLNENAVEDNKEEIEQEIKQEIESEIEQNNLENIIPVKESTTNTDKVDIEVKEIVEEKSEADNLADKLVDNFGQFDPKLELGKFQFPKLNLLKQYDSEKITIDKDELEENKNRIRLDARHHSGDDRCVA